MATTPEEDFYLQTARYLFVFESASQIAVSNAGSNPPTIKPFQEKAILAAISYYKKLLELELSDGSLTAFWPKQEALATSKTAFTGLTTSLASVTANDMYKHAETVIKALASEEVTFSFTERFIEEYVLKQTATGSGALVKLGYSANNSVGVQDLQIKFIDALTKDLAHLRLCDGASLGDKGKITKKITEYARTLNDISIIQGELFLRKLFNEMAAIDPLSGGKRERIPELVGPILNVLMPDVKVWETAEKAIRTLDWKVSLAQSKTDFASNVTTLTNLRDAWVASNGVGIETLASERIEKAILEAFSALSGLFDTAAKATSGSPVAAKELAEAIRDVLTSLYTNTTSKVGFSFKNWEIQNTMAIIEFNAKGTAPSGPPPVPTGTVLPNYDTATIDDLIKFATKNIQYPFDPTQTSNYRGTPKKEHDTVKTNLGNALDVLLTKKLTPIAIGPGSGQVLDVAFFGRWLLGHFQETKAIIPSELEKHLTVSFKEVETMLDAHVKKHAVTAKIVTDKDDGFEVGGKKFNLFDVLVAKIVPESNKTATKVIGADQISSGGVYDLIGGSDASVDNRRVATDEYLGYLFACLVRQAFIKNGFAILSPGLKPKLTYVSGTLNSDALSSVLKSERKDLEDALSWGQTDKGFDLDDILTSGDKPGKSSDFGW